MSGTPVSSGAPPLSYDTTTSAPLLDPSPTISYSEAATTEPQSHAFPMLPASVTPPPAGLTPLPLGLTPRPSHSHSDSPGRETRSQSRARTQSQSQSAQRCQTLKTQGQGCNQGRSQGSPQSSCPVCGLPVQLTASDAATPAPDHAARQKPNAVANQPLTVAASAGAPSVVPETPLLPAIVVPAVAGPVRDPAAAVGPASDGAPTDGSSGGALDTIPETPSAALGPEQAAQVQQSLPNSQRRRRQQGGEEADSMNVDGNCRGSQRPPQTLRLELSSDGEVGVACIP